MKKLIMCLTAILAIATLVTTGCAKKDIDTSKVQEAFKSAEGVDKADIDQAISNVKTGNYAAALSSLQKAATNTKLTPEQKAAVQDLITQVQDKVTGMAKQVGEDASKTASDLQKQLPK